MPGSGIPACLRRFSSDKEPKRLFERARRASSGRCIHAAFATIAWLPQLPCKSDTLYSGSFGPQFAHLHMQSKSSFDLGLLAAPVLRVLVCSPRQFTAGSRFAHRAIPPPDFVLLAAPVLHQALAGSPHGLLAAPSLSRISVCSLSQFLIGS